VLTQRAGSLPLSTYIKGQVLEDRPNRPSGRAVRSGVDQRILASLLAILGRTELASSLDRLATAAAEGSLLVDERVAAQLNGACDDVRLMHNALMQALGKRGKTPGSHERRAKQAFSAAAELQP